MLTNEVLTIDELKSRFDSEWVLLEDPEVDKQQRVVRGKLVWHSTDRDDVYRQAAARRLKHGALLFAGEMPEDAVIIL